MSDGAAPRLSVVVASAAGGDFLARCLGSLAEQAKRTGAEVVVVDRRGEAWREAIRQRHPSVRVLARPQAAGRPGVPELRAHGVDAARAPVVAVIEEHCVAPPGWIEAILAAFAPEDAAVGGPILDDDYRRLRDWVVYFSEYHNDLPPWPAGPCLWLNDANAAYRRSVLVEHRARLGESYWAIALHPLLMAEGRRLRAVPEMGVRHTGPFDYAYYLRQRYWLSRLWGGTERRRAARARRFLHLAAGPVFPLFLLARIARRVLAARSPRLGARFLLAAPLLVPVVVAYTLGEWLGYLIGPGRAAEVVE